MTKIAIAVGLSAALAVGSFAFADDVTIINRDNDVDTTGSIIIKKQKPRVVVKESPTIVVKERSEPQVVIKEKRKKLVIEGETD